MAKRRDQIRMSDEEMWAFIEEQKSMQVATLNRDGSAHLTTLWFAIVDGALVFETFTKSQKIKNLERDPRIAILFEDGVEYGELRGVSINANAEVYSDSEKVHELAKQVMIRNNPDVPRESLDEAAKQLASKRSGVVVRPEKVVSWDHRKLGGGY
ncbi:pyridoxamine 5'-phosphate oxidase family protein [Myxococcota bacterium]|nr:pyridoxamine 5'-phosphate oxidase family protein [Myxococcota bacterium]